MQYTVTADSWYWIEAPRATFDEKAARLATAFQQRAERVRAGNGEALRFGNTSPLQLNQSESFSWFYDEVAELALRIQKEAARLLAFEQSGLIEGLNWATLRVAVASSLEVILADFVWDYLGHYFQSEGSDADTQLCVERFAERYSAFLQYGVTLGFASGNLVESPFPEAAAILSGLVSEAVKLFLKVQQQHTSNGIRWRRPDIKHGAKLPRASIS